jgi:hypothetical protein
MKKILRSLFSVLALSAPLTIGAQTTATNFSCNDCAGNNHDLFAELNAGKVIVISWVMPCSACTPPTQTAFGVVQSYAVSNPGQVLLYIADDYANTTCATLNNWAMGNSLGGATTFSDPAVSMSPYGTPGMPKIIVVGGGYNHTVYFNENNSAANDASAIQAAVDSALADITGMQTPEGLISVNLFPNPANGSASLTIHATHATGATVKVLNVAGQEVMNAYAGTLAPGANRITFSTEELAEGAYFVQVTDGEKSSVVKMIISR